MFYPNLINIGRVNFIFEFADLWSIRAKWIDSSTNYVQQP